jgi:protein-tyrosine-phosphatase/predicted ATP-grasp superfamily ATP-dependent carboligase
MTRVRKTNGRVLVLGDEPSVCLAVVRSLGRYGLSVVFGTQDAASILRYSKYLSEIIDFPPAAEGMDAWCDKLEQVLSAGRFGLVIPVADGCLVPMALNRSRFERLAQLAIPDADGFEITYRKQRTMEMADHLGVPIPRTELVCEPGRLDDLEASQALGLPVVIKPVSSKIWNGNQRTDHFAAIGHDWAEIRRRVNTVLKTTPVLLQSYAPGVGVGQEFLAKDGEILSVFQHERLHEPIGGGGSYYRKSVPVNCDMLKHSAAMLKHMKWTGVAMVEYKWDRVSGEFALMEINGRFWGSLPLAVAAGVDFPADLYSLMAEGREIKRSTYPIGVYCRKATHDVQWFCDNWRADHRNPYLMAVPRSRAILEWANVLRGKEHWDSLTWDDPGPGFEDWRRLARHKKKILRLKAKNFSLGRLAKSAMWRRLQQQRCMRLLKQNPHVLFLCYGNICRSRFAEEYALRKMEQLGIVGLQILSAGFHPVNDRPSPATAQNVGEELGISLRGGRSKMLTTIMVDQAGAILCAILCMDLKNYHQFCREWPGAKHKIFFLAPFGSATLQVDDPWAESDTHFRNCFRLIARCVDRLLTGAEQSGIVRPTESALASGVCDAERSAELVLEAAAVVNLGAQDSTFRISRGEARRRP